MKKPKIFRKKDVIEEKIDEFLEKGSPKVEDFDDCTDDEIHRRCVKHECDLKAYEREASALRDLSEAKKNTQWHGLSADAVLGAGVTLLGIVLMLNYEKTDVIHSKVSSFIPKIRI